VGFYDGPWQSHHAANFKSLPSVVAEILKENPQFVEAPLAKGTLSYEYDFMMGLGKPKPHTKFNIASFSRCRHIKGNPKILRSSSSPWVGFCNAPWQNPGSC